MESEQKANKNRTKANKSEQDENSYTTCAARFRHDRRTAKSKIGKGLLVLVGIEDKDTQEDIEWLAKNDHHLRILTMKTGS
mgnify:CR=1 FL=1